MATSQCVTLMTLIAYETSRPERQTFKVRNPERLNQVSVSTLNKHGVRPDPEAVEAALTWKAPKTDTRLMSPLGFANYYREFNKGYVDKIYPMQKLTRIKGKNSVGLKRLRSPLRISRANFGRLRSSACRQKRGCLC